jgi:retinol dehydrogenase 14
MIPDLRGKTALVTGASSGLGLATSVALASGGARVVMVGRNPAKTNAALDEVCRRSGSALVEALTCDFGSQAAIRQLAADVLGRAPSLDILINNAGSVNIHRTLTADGIERTFAVNHLAGYLLTRLLADRIVASAPARIVNVSSNAHYNATLDFDDLGFERGYHILKAYSRSKLANVLFSRELSRRLAATGVAVNALHPGMVATDIWRGAPGWTQPLFALAKRLVMMSPEEGAMRIMYVAVGNATEGMTGQYFDRNLSRQPSKLALDDRVAARLWQESARLTHLDP